MTPQTADQLIIVPTLAWLGAPYDSPEARLLLLAIALQESHLKHRKQQPVAHAKGFWQFEKGGGCAGFETDPHQKVFRKAATALNFPFRSAETWTLIGEGADHLACVMARGLLWSHPKPLPTIGDEEAAFAYYLKQWRPAPKNREKNRLRWTTTYPMAREVTGL
jgi:hypothetical protein